jgi:hypothetical protein
MREYLLAFPGYTGNCGGIRFGHKLCHMLNERGYKAYITGDYTNPLWNTPKAKELSQEKLRDLQHNGIIIYPDIIPNNPVNFTHCVKWWMGSSQLNPINQLVFSFSEMHDVVFKNENHLFIWDVEDFFKDPEIENRHGSCVYSGKGNGIDNEPVPETGTATVRAPGCYMITAGDPPNRQALANLLKSVEVMYCFDNLTFMMTEARLCGVPVILIGHRTIPREDFIKKDEFSQFGIGMYEDKPDIKKLKAEIPLFREAYQKRVEKTEIEFNKFIELTQSWNPNNIFVEDVGPFQPTIYEHPNFELFRTR